MSRRAPTERELADRFRFVRMSEARQALCERIGRQCLDLALFLAEVVPPGVLLDDALDSLSEVLVRTTLAVRVGQPQPPD